jgi:hypothetical protein
VAGCVAIMSVRPGRSNDTRRVPSHDWNVLPSLGSRLWTVGGADPTSANGRLRGRAAEILENHAHELPPQPDTHKQDDPLHAQN